MNLRTHAEPAVRRVGAMVCRQGGMSVIELIVVLLIIGILAAIGISSYSNYIVRGQRAAAKATLMQTGQAMERYYTACGSYSSQTCTAVNYPLAGNPCAAMAPMAPSSASYCVTGVATAQTYLLSATPCGDSGACPLPANNSFQDPQCDVLTLDNTGTKGAAGSPANQALVAQCWQQ